jgi:hypothetical protein
MRIRFVVESWILKKFCIADISTMEAKAKLKGL